MTCGYYRLRFVGNKVIINMLDIEKQRIHNKR
jgi:hypothetical protein